jgi:AbrB family looped-hinge helix DNA binding protein
LKSTGMVRRLDALGRIVIPKEIRRMKRIKAGDPIEMFLDGDNIILRRYNPGAVTMTELTDAFIAVCKKHGEKPSDYLDIIREEET